MGEEKIIEMDEQQFLVVQDSSQVDMWDRKR